MCNYGGYILILFCFLAFHLYEFLVNNTFFLHLIDQLQLFFIFFYHENFEIYKSREDGPTNLIYCIASGFDNDQNLVTLTYPPSVPP